MKAGKNRYYRRSRISVAQFRELMRAFALDLTASDAAELTGLSTRRINDIYLKVRGKTAEFREFQSPYRGEVEVDESYFGPRQVRGKRGRGAGGKTIVFGIFERNGHVDTGIVLDAEKNTLVKAIRGQVDPQSVIHSDGGGGTTGWLTSASPSTSESTIPSATSPTAAATSTASSRCGATPNDG
jgi:transposase